MDNVLLASELIKGYGRKGLSPRCMIKINLQNAYDSVDWNFLNQMFLRLGFPINYVNWIMCCVTTVSCSVQINGCPLPPFQAKKSLRQGDPFFSLPLYFYYGVFVTMLGNLEKYKWI